MKELFAASVLSSYRTMDIRNENQTHTCFISPPLVPEQGSMIKFMF